MVAVTFYNPNIDQRIVDAQKSVFDHFGIEVNQVLTDLQHPDAIDEYLRNNDFETIAIFDIDCIPLHKDVIKDAEWTARHGVIYGAAQKASHIKGSEIYVSPAFVCFSKATFERLGKPSFAPTYRGDVGSELTYVANEKNVLCNIIYPVSVEVPKWPLSELQMFGNGTNYDNIVYHAFESRMNGVTSMFIRKCYEVINSSPVNAK